MHERCAKDKNFVRIHPVLVENSVERGPDPIVREAAVFDLILYSTAVKGCGVCQVSDAHDQAPERRDVSRIGEQDATEVQVDTRC